MQRQAGGINGVCKQHNYAGSPPCMHATYDTPIKFCPTSDPFPMEVKVYIGGDSELTYQAAHVP